jgi:dipeptide/tripeptide permease
MEKHIDFKNLDSCIFIKPGTLLFFSQLSLFGLTLIAIGSGGIKPCLSAFGGDQFISAESDQMRQVTIELFLIESIF